MFFIPVPTPTSKIDKKKRIPKPKKTLENQSKEMAKQVAEGALFYETINLLTPKPTDNIQVIEDLTFKHPAGTAIDCSEDRMLESNIDTNTQTVLETVFGGASIKDAEEAFQITWDNQSASEELFEGDTDPFSYISRTKAFIDDVIPIIERNIKFADVEHNVNLAMQQDLNNKLLELEIEIRENSDKRHRLRERLACFQEFRNTL